MVNDKDPNKINSGDNDRPDKTVLDQSSADDVGQGKHASAIVGKLEKTLNKHGLELLEKGKTTRIYRRKPDLPNPDKSTQSESNRLTKKINTRISSGHVELFNTCVHKFPNGRAALEHAIEVFARDCEIDPGEYIIK